MPNQIKIFNKIKSFDKTIEITSDKSLSIRAILLASQAIGVSTISNLLESEDDLGNQWNLSKDGNMMIIGVQKKMTKGVTVAMNVQSWQEATLETEEEADRENTFYINLEYKF